MSTPPRMNVAVCIYDDVTTLDFHGPVAMLGSVEWLLKVPGMGQFGALPSEPKYVFDIDYLSKSLDAVKPLDASPRILPTITYEQALASKKYDIIVVPAGTISDVPTEVEAVDFLSKAGPSAKYILTVCGGSAILARTGLLDGKKATTNKAWYKFFTQPHPKVNWVPKARWVVDGNIWTASGVTAGFDMAHAFATHLLGEPIAKVVSASIEYRPSLNQDEDEFATMHGVA